MFYKYWKIMTYAFKTDFVAFKLNISDFDHWKGDTANEVWPGCSPGASVILYREDRLGLTDKIVGSFAKDNEVHVWEKYTCM